MDAYLEDVVSRLRRHAGERLVGVWLLGSAALGDFDPVRSDLDVQAVTSERLTLAERQAIVAELVHEALPVPARGLELVLYARDDLEQAAYQLNLNSGPRMDRHVSFDADGDPRFWFVIDLSIGRAHGRALAGPEIADVIPELPRPLVVDALREALDWFDANDSGGARPSSPPAAHGRGRATVCGCRRATRPGGHRIGSDPPCAARPARGTQSDRLA